MPGCGTAMTSLDGRDSIGRGTACKQDRSLIEMFARPRERALHFLRPVDESVWIESQDRHRPLGVFDLCKRRLRTAAGKAGSPAADGRTHWFR